MFQFVVIKNTFYNSSVYSFPSILRGLWTKPIQNMSPIRKLREKMLANRNRFIQSIESTRLLRVWRDESDCIRCTVLSVLRMSLFTYSKSIFFFSHFPVWWNMKKFKKKCRAKCVSHLFDAIKLKCSTCSTDHRMRCNALRDCIHWICLVYVGRFPFYFPSFWNCGVVWCGDDDGVATMASYIKHPQKQFWNY